MDTAIRFKSLTDQVYEYLYDYIVEGKFKPGEKLTETDLCGQFNVSRSPIRECFRILESEGLIVIEPRKGAFVKDLSKKEIEDTFIVVANLESLAAKLATPIMNEKEIEFLNDLIIRMETHIKKKDIQSFRLLNEKFHTAFIKTSRNEVLERTIENFRKGFIFRYIYLYYKSPSGMDDANTMHKLIVKAFEDKDALSAQRYVQEHVENFARQLLLII